ncbi:hypothetical protein CsSME_00013887 [Camellia sinensis var. sinensis]
MLLLNLLGFQELLALEERIGNVNTGLTEETILNRLKQRKHFSIAMGAQLEVEPCCICRVLINFSPYPCSYLFLFLEVFVQPLLFDGIQEEYNDGEDIGTLECGHEFHSNCIKQWLMQKNLCPICKTTGLSK